MTIVDLTQIILSLSTEYTKVTYTQFNHNGMTYTKPNTTSKVHGILVPIVSDTRVELLGLGHAVEGESIIDLQGTEWVVNPHNADYSDVANLVQYGLDRKVF